MGEYYDSGGNGLEYAVKTVKRSLCAVATAILIPVLLWAQQPELQLDTAGYRSLRTGVWLLLEKTGWHICLEEPLVDLLSRSKTTLLYQLNCQVGVNSAGECTLSLRPLTIEVVGRSGALRNKTVYFDRGRPEVALPPDPPDPK
jgi:hypothetical protein